MRNKQYYIFNNAYTPEAYAEEIKKFNDHSYHSMVALRARLKEFYLTFPKKYIEGTNNSNISGDYIYHSKNVKNGYELLGVDDSRYCHFLFLRPTKDSYDFTMWGGNASRMYECIGAGGGQSDVKFSFECWTAAQDLAYCWYILRGGGHLFGCVGTKGNQYCILNKQYTKEEFEILIPKIKAHMNAMPYVDVRGRVYRYGEFFPPEFSTFAYNETIAQAYLPLTKEEAVRQGYAWKNFAAKQYQITLKADDLPETIGEVDDYIIDEIIGCAHQGLCNEQCATASRITKRELEFYRAQKFSLPRLCPNCRHYQRMSERAPINKLYHRACMCGVSSTGGIYKNTVAHFHGDKPCPNEFETSYAPGRKEIVYCEQCYQNEVV